MLVLAADEVAYLLAMLTGHDELINDLEYRPDGEVLVSPSEDGSLFMYAVADP
jgi:WD40 repeat protein